MEVDGTNSGETEDEKALVEVEEYAPEIRDVYQGIKVLNSKNESIKKEDNRDFVINSVPKRGKIKKKSSSKKSKGTKYQKKKHCSENVLMIPCKVELERYNKPNSSKTQDEHINLNLNEASLDVPSRAVEITQNDENLPNALASLDVPSRTVEVGMNEENLLKDNALLNIKPRKYRNKSKRVKINEEFILQNCPGVLRRSQRIKDKILKEKQCLIEKKKSALHKSVENSQTIRNRKHKLRKPISKQKYLNQAPTTFESLVFRNGKKIYGFRWDGCKETIYIPEEKLTESMKVLLKSVLQLTLLDMNNPLYYKSVDVSKKNSNENPTSNDEDRGNVSNVDCFGFNETIRNILQYRNVQKQMQSKYMDSNGQNEDIDIKFHIE